MIERSYRDLWTKSADGLTLHARLYGEDGPERPVILCLPGLSRHAGDFHDFGLALAGEAGPPRQLLAIDYRGRGLSDHDPDPAKYSVPVETADLLGFLDEFGIRRAVFVGASRGGIITMAVAAARPGLVAGAILNDIGPVIERAGLLRIKGYVGKLAAPRDLDEAATRIKALFGPQFPALSDLQWRRWAENTWEERAGDLALTYDPALARTLDPIERDTEIPDLWPLFDALKSVPVLVVRGANSDLLSAETVDRMGEVHPDLEAVTVADQGHTPLLETPDLVAVIRRFIQRLDGPTSGR